MYSVYVHEGQRNSFSSQEETWRQIEKWTSEAGDKIIMFMYTMNTVKLEKNEPFNQEQIRGNYTGL
ncbi:MAG: hypothetical protein MRERC_5c048 [Mycoplasmataceae bacterium RC_NB112A]|nr:MAG: hypothetical protein MRERC_5c048 [Mycoplasmataceae bacterium RC_NB112A]